MDSMWAAMGLLKWKYHCLVWQHNFQPREYIPLERDLRPLKTAGYMFICVNDWKGQIRQVLRLYSRIIVFYAGGNSVVKCDVGFVHRAIGLLKDEYTIVMITENRLITCIQSHQNF